MHVQQIDEGLWRWTAPHPNWADGKDWDRMVGCVYWETPDAIVLIDPQAPPPESPEAAKFWSALDRDVERQGTPVVSVIGNTYHSRSAREVYQRFAGRTGGRVLVPEGFTGGEAIATGTFGPDDRLPGGMEAWFIEGLVDPEVVFHIPPHRALVVADALIGDGQGGVRVAPESWGDNTEEGAARYRATFRDSLRRLADLDFERLLTSHGEPLLSGGKQALTRALEGPAHGE
jgi:glyoxylase-like metal-dependent hydrolase (beta-lactamase superfamily II)